MQVKIDIIDNLVYKNCHQILIVLPYTEITLNTKMFDLSDSHEL